MNTRTIINLTVLTVIYLCLELGFNARLLDALGGHVNSGQVHHLEEYGRSLSGAAVALFVLQLAMHLRQHPPAFARGIGGASFWLLTVVMCGVAAYGIFLSLEKYTNYRVNITSGEFRRASMTAVLAKSAMVDGVTRLGNLSGAERLQDLPEGKAFLALFPLFATSMESLESEFAPDKKAQVRKLVEQPFRGPAAYYANYKKAIGDTLGRWRKYNEANPSNLRTKLDTSIKAEQDKAWTQYLRDLGRHHMSPYTVPYEDQERVRAKIRARIPIPDNWDLTDEATFREAVARKARQAADKRLDTHSVNINGSQVPFGLGWEQFLTHPAVQDELRKGLHLPRSVVVRPRYASGEEFQRQVFDPAVNMEFQKLWPAYNADATQFADGGRYEDKGREAARAVIVPPLALFFSLLGALMHMTKLTWMISKLIFKRMDDGERQASRERRANMVTSGIIATTAMVIVMFCYIDNPFTRSMGYLQLENKVASSEARPVQAWLRARTLHGVAVGQGLFFPMDEWIRVKLLFGLKYGFDPKQENES